MYFQGDPLTHPCIWSPPSPQENPISSPRFSISASISSVRIQREWCPHTNLATRPQVPRGFSGQKALYKHSPILSAGLQGPGGGGSKCSLLRTPSIPQTQAPEGKAGVSPALWELWVFPSSFSKCWLVHLNPHTLSMDVIQPGSSGMLSRLPVLQPAKLCGQPRALLGEAAWFRRGLEAFWKSLNLFYDILTNSMKGCTPSQNTPNFRGGGWRRVRRDRRLKCITLDQSHSDGLWLW